MPVEVTEAFRDAAFWSECYDRLRAAVLAHLGQFVFDGDEAEEFLLCEGVRRAGCVLRDCVATEDGDYVIRPGRRLAVEGVVLCSDQELLRRMKESP